MLLREEDLGVFKRWLLPKLETISEADAEVLADYVIALVTANDSEANIRRNCLESLADFLQDHTAAFVEDTVKALKNKSYVERAPAQQKPAPPSVPRKAAPLPIPAGTNGTTAQGAPSRREKRKASAAPKPSIAEASRLEYELQSSQHANRAPFHAPRGPAATKATSPHNRLHDRPTIPTPTQSHSPGIGGRQNGVQASRKRKLRDRESSEVREGYDAHDRQTAGGSRPTKQTARRGNKILRGSAPTFEPKNGRPAFAPMPTMPNVPNFANLPPPPPGLPPFDVNNPMTFFALMTALGTAMPGMPSLPPFTQINGVNGQVHKAKCYDYHTKGFCGLGTMCPYEHSATAEDVPGYDPNQPSLSTHSVPVENGRQGTNSRFDNRINRRERAPFSLSGPSHDTSLTTLVVENIPAANNNEVNVRGFFSQFGVITDVQMQAHRRIAIVNFANHDAANKAYNSPKAVFDNRFVKVYWKRADTVIGPSITKFEDVEMTYDEEFNEPVEEEEPLSREEIARRQGEAQKAFEERRRRKEDAEVKAAEIERQLREKDAEMRRTRQQLAERARSELSENFTQDLATLQAEAEDLFVQTDGSAPVSRGRGVPTRGAYRGRGVGSIAPRGRGFTPDLTTRGAQRGRGTFSQAFNGRGFTKRLDNRPRRLAVANIEKGSTKDEELRQYLAGVGECKSIDPHPDQPQTLILTFQERFQAETFLDRSRNIPDMDGPLNISWVANEAFGGIKPTTTTVKDEDMGPHNLEDSDEESSVSVKEEKPGGEGVEHGIAPDADMDVADDVDQWL